MHLRRGSKSLGASPPLNFSILRSLQGSSRRILQCAISLKDEGNHPHFLLQAGRIVAIDRCPTPRSTGPPAAVQITLRHRRNSGGGPLAKTKLTVSATGDSRYWPRPEDAHYDNKPGKDFNTRLGSPGAERFVEPAGRRPRYGSRSCGNSTHQAPRNLPIGRP